MRLLGYVVRVGGGVGVWKSAMVDSGQRAMRPASCGVIVLWRLPVALLPVFTPFFSLTDITRVLLSRLNLSLNPITIPSFFSFCLTKVSINPSTSFLKMFWFDRSCASILKYFFDFVRKWEGRLRKWVGWEWEFCSTDYVEGLLG